MSKETTTVRGNSACAIICSGAVAKHQKMVAPKDNLFLQSFASNIPTLQSN